MIARHEVATDKTDIWALLSAPLPEGVISWRQDGRAVQRDGKFFARFVAYIEANTVRERLDSVVPGEWDLTLELLPILTTVDAGYDAIAGTGWRCSPSRRSCSQKKITGVTTSTCRSDETMPPRTGVASGFITSAPTRVLHMIGSSPAITVLTVITFGRSRSNAPSTSASRSAVRVSVPPCSRRFLATASSR